MALTSKTKVENYLKRALTAREDAMLSLLIAAVTKHIEKLIGYTIENSSSSSQTFVAQRGRYLFLNGLVRTITAVQLLNDDGSVDSTLTSGVDYIAHPQNKDQKRYIEYLGNAHSGWVAQAPNFADRQLVKVTGKFSYADADGAPEDLQLCATIWVAEILANPQKLKRESIEGYSRDFRTIEEQHPEITLTLESYGFGAPQI